MSTYAIRRRVVCYVTRPAVAGLELLVLDHVEDDPVEPSGVQVPAGGMLPFESLDAAASREIEEECGLMEVTFESQLGAVELGLREPGGPSLSTFVHVSAPGGGERSWLHKVSGDGPDSAMTFRCRWEPLPLTFELASGQAAYLDRITG